MVSFDRGPAVGKVYANGEIVQDDESDKKRRSPRRDGGPVYAMLELDALQNIQPLLKPAQANILGMILSDYREDEPWCRATATDLAGRLGVKVPNFYRSLRALQESGLVYRLDSTTWQVNPYYGWRGARKAWMEAIASADYPDLEKLRG